MKQSRRTISIPRRTDRRLAMIARYYGLRPQLKKTNEELRELIHAIQTLRFMLWLDRADKKHFEHVHEEIADVRIMLDQIELLTGGNQSCSEWRTAKLERQVQRINGERKCITSKTSSHFS